MSNDKLKKTTTTNGATAFATAHLADDIEGTDQVKSLVALISEMWSATMMNPTVVANKFKECLYLADGITDAVDKANFIALCMAFAMYRRDPRHGGGRRDESRAMIFSIFNHFGDNHDMCKSVLKWYFNQGYWGDAKKIIEIFTNNELFKDVINVFVNNPNLVNLLKTMTCELIAEQLAKDLELSKQLDTVKSKIKEDNKDDANSIDEETKEEIKKICLQISSCAKWVPMPRASGRKTSSKTSSPDLNTDANVDRNKKPGKLSKKVKKNISKDRVAMALCIAQQMYPDIKENTYYYAQKKGKVDRSTKLPVTNKTPVYLRWLNLFTAYQNTVKSIRTNIPYVEKFTQKNKYHTINPSMMTSVNKLRLNDAIKNELPRYIKTGRSKHIPAAKIQYLKETVYGKEKRFEDSKDRDDCKKKMEEYEAFVSEKLKEKQKKMEELRNKRDELLKKRNADSQDSELDEINKQLEELASEKTTNFDAGTPLDVYFAYEKGGITHDNPTYENCIMELITGKLHELAQIPILCVADTSGSMYTSYGTSRISDMNNITPISMCMAMTAFFAKAAPEAWKHRFIQFSGESYVINLATTLNKENPSFLDYIKYMKSHQVNAGSTNFMSVVNQLRLLFTKNNNEEGNDIILPKYLVWFSDMQFDVATGAHQQYGVENIEQMNTTGLAAGEMLEKLFIDELGYTKEETPTVIFWNLNCHDNRPAVATHDKMIMVAGNNPQIIVDIDKVVDNAASFAEYSSEYEKIKAEGEKIRKEMEAERQKQYQKQREEQLKKQRVDTWKTIVQVLASSEATVPFLEDMKRCKYLEHTLVDELNDLNDSDDYELTEKELAVEIDMGDGTVSCNNCIKTIDTDDYYDLTNDVDEDSSSSTMSDERNINIGTSTDTSSNY